MADGKAQIELSAVDRTAAAFASVQRGIAGVEQAVSNAALAFNVWGKALDVALKAAQLAIEKVDFRTVIDAADQMFKLSERTGLAVEQLSALSYAGKLANVSVDDLAVALKQFNANIAAAARGEKEQLGVFEAMGISQKFLKENIGDTGKILDVVADKFASYAAGANKVDLAKGLGKSFEQLIPLLNGGSEGFRNARQELEKFGSLLTGDLAKKSQDFNDNMTRLAAAGEALKITLASGLIDRLVALSEEFVTAARSGTTLELVLSKLKDVLSGKATWKLAFGADPELDNAIAKVDQLRGKIAALNAGDQAAPNAFAKASIEALKTELSGAEEILKRIENDRRGKQVGGGRGLVNPDLVVPAKLPQAPARKPNDPKTDKISAYDQLITRIKERMALEQEELTLGRELTASEKFSVDITNALLEAIKKEGTGREVNVKAMRDQVAAIIAENDARTAATKAAEEKRREMEREVQAIVQQNTAQADQNKRLQDAVEEIGLGIDALEKLRVKRLEDALATEKQADAEANLTAGMESGMFARAARIQVLERELALTKEGTKRAKESAADEAAGFSRAIERFTKDTEEVGLAIERLTTDGLRGLEDEMTKLVTGQKTNFKGLVDSIISEILRLKVIKPFLSSLFGDGTSGGAVGGVLKGLLGSPNAAGGSASAGFGTGAGFGNQDIGMFIGSASSARSGTSAQSITYSPTINVDSRSDRAAVAQDTVAIVNASQKQFADHLRASGVMR